MSRFPLFQNAQSAMSFDEQLNEDVRVQQDSHLHIAFQPGLDVFLRAMPVGDDDLDFSFSGAKFGAGRCSG